MPTRQPDPSQPCRHVSILYLLFYSIFDLFSVSFSTLQAGLSHEMLQVSCLSPKYVIFPTISVMKPTEGIDFFQYLKSLIDKSKLNTIILKEYCLKQTSLEFHLHLQFSCSLSRQENYNTLDSVSL